MKATELRIANYVQNHKGDICKVTKLNIEDREDYIRAWQRDRPAFGTANPEPIPITEEWLKKFGWNNLYDSGTKEEENRPFSG